MYCLDGRSKAKIEWSKNQNCLVVSNFIFFFSPLSTTWTWQTWDDFRWHMRVSINGGTPKSSTLIWFSLINHPFWGTPIHGNPHMVTFIFFRLHESTSRQGHRGWAGGDLQRVPPRGTGVPAAAGAGRADQDGRAGESPEWKRYGYGSIPIEYQIWLYFRGMMMLIYVNSYN